LLTVGREQLSKTDTVIVAAIETGVALLVEPTKSSSTSMASFDERR
jgi:hypothetical protein